MLTLVVVSSWVVFSAPAAAAPPPTAATRAAAIATFERPVAKAFPRWEIDDFAEGDLNGDLVKDLVVTLKGPEPKPQRADEYVERPALLAVFFRTPAGELRLHTKAPRAVCIGCGGAKASWEDVLGTPSIDQKGILTVEYEGGSRDVWNYRLKWRYDKTSDHLALIGETYSGRDSISDNGEGDRGSLSDQDINYLTGKMTRKVVGQGRRTCTVKPGLACADLAAFDFGKLMEVDEKHVKGSCKK